MTIISDDPSWWPIISSSHFFSYFFVASFTAAIYDWALTIGQEIELIWRQRWSLMTVLYVGARYLGILYSLVFMLEILPSVSLTDLGCTILEGVDNTASVVVNFLVGVIMIIRLHAMYQQSSKMLVFLVAIFLTIQITCGVIFVVSELGSYMGEEFILSGSHLCGSQPVNHVLVAVTWILGTLWEVLALCLAVWIAVKHFRELQRPSTGWTAVEDCFTMLMKSHAFYFAPFLIVTCLHLGYLSPKIADSTSTGVETYEGILLIVGVVQMSVLGPRLILGIREYHAKLVADSDEGTAMASIVFHGRVHISTGSGV